jgi:hypothetical protein
LISSELCGCPPVSLTEYKFQAKSSEYQQNDYLGNSDKIPYLARFRGSPEINIAKKQGCQGSKYLLGRKKSPVRENKVEFPQNMLKIGPETKCVKAACHCMGKPAHPA